VAVLGALWSLEWAWDMVQETCAASMSLESVFIISTLSPWQFPRTRGWPNNSTTFTDVAVTKPKKKISTY